MSEPADIIELYDTIEDLANAMAAANNGVVDMLELRRSVLETLGERFQPRMDTLLEQQVQVCALDVMKMHYLDVRLAEVKDEIRRKRRNGR